MLVITVKRRVARTYPRYKNLLCIITYFADGLNSAKAGARGRGQ